MINNCNIFLFFFFFGIFVKYDTLKFRIDKKRLKDTLFLEKNCFTFLIKKSDCIFSSR